MRKELSKDPGRPGTRRDDGGGGGTWKRKCDDRVLVPGKNMQHPDDGVNVRR